MSFKDKLFAFRKSKTDAENLLDSDEISQIEEAVSEDAFHVEEDNLDSVFMEQNASDAIDDFQEDGVSDIQTDSFSDVFEDEYETTQDFLAVPASGSKPNKEKTKLKIYIALALLALVALSALAINQFMSSNTKDDVNLQPVQEKKSTAVKPPSDSTVVSSQKTDEEVKKLKESIDAPLPENDVMAAEELDALGDERARLVKQQKLITEQIDTAKRLTELKDKEIAMLEQKIKEEEALIGAQKAAQSSTQAAKATKATN